MTSPRPTRGRRGEYDAQAVLFPARPAFDRVAIQQRGAMAVILVGDVVIGVDGVGRRGRHGLIAAAVELRKVLRDRPADGARLVEHCREDGNELGGVWAELAAKVPPPRGIYA